MNYRACIALLLKGGGFLLFVLVVSVVLWAVLKASGDSSWAVGLQGVVLATLVCWVLDFVALVVLLALAYLASTDQSEANETEMVEE